MSDALLDVACGQTSEHWFVRIEGVLDLAIEIVVTRSFLEDIVEEEGSDLSSRLRADHGSPD